MFDKNNLIYKSVKVKAPASVANLVCGFDVLGMALSAPYDEMELTITANPGIVIKHVDAYNLPTVATQNVAGVSLLTMINALGVDVGFEVVINKIIKPGSGLGSSAASAAGVVVAANYLLNNYFDKQALVGFAMHGEQLASGVMHADNITPCIYGGITLIRATHPLDIVTLPSPALYVTIIHPQIEIKTADARQILRKEVQLQAAIKQWGNVGGLVAGLFKNDYGLISRSLQDVIVEPVRSMLIPAFDLIKQASINAGALGGGISGSGPSIFMLSITHDVAQLVEKQMCAIYDKLGIAYHSHVTTINNDGVKIIME